MFWLGKTQINFQLHLTLVPDIFQLVTDALDIFKKILLLLFRRNFADPEAPVSFTYSLVFNGTEPLIQKEIDDLIEKGTESFDFSGSKWILFGDDWLINELEWNEIKINISDYLFSLIPTTPPSTGKIEHNDFIIGAVEHNF